MNVSGWEPESEKLCGTVDRFSPKTRCERKQFDYNIVILTQNDYIKKSLKWL